MIDNVVYAALNATGYPVTQIPIRLNADVCLTWEDVLGTAAAYSSNSSRRVNHLVSVHIFAKQAVTDTVFKTVAAQLKKAGIMPTSWGPEDFEQDTGWYHLPVSCNYNETLTI